MTIGSLTLSPAFDPAVTEYSATTTNATNTVTAIASDENAEVNILLNGSTAVASGTPATWVVGQNDLTITVTNGDAVKTYMVTVTKSE